MATLTSKLILSLIDEVTAPARAISATLDRLNAIQRRNNARLDAMRGSMIESGAVAYALARAITSPTRAAAEFETKLEDIAQKVGAPIAAAVGSWATQKLIDFAAWFGIDEKTVRSSIDSAISTITALPAKIDEIVQSVSDQAGDWFSDIFTMNEYSEADTQGFRDAGERVGKALVDSAKSTFSDLTALGSDLTSTGAAWGREIWSGVEDKIDAMVEWFKNLPDRIIAAIGSIDIGSLIDWPTPPAWLSGWWSDDEKGAQQQPPGAPAGRGAEPVSRIAAEAAAANGNSQAAIDAMLKSMGRLAGEVEKEGAAAVSAADTIGAAIDDNISITAIPVVDTSGIDAARTKVDALARALQSMPSTVVTATAPALAGARASGGPVKAGGAYLVGEEGPELVTFGQNGIVHDAMKTARVIRNAAFASASMALPAAAAMPVLPDIPSFEIALPEITLPRVPQLSARPPAQEAGKGAARPVQVTLSNGAIKIEVNAAPGQSPERIAEEVERRLSARFDSMSSGSFSDGAN